MANMILTKDDFQIYGNRVKLDLWMKKHEMEQILQDEKLRELIEKRLKDLKKAYPKEDRYPFEEEIILQTLLEESKK